MSELAEAYNLAEEKDDFIRYFHYSRCMRAVLSCTCLKITTSAGRDANETVFSPLT